VPTLEKEERSVYRVQVIERAIGMIESLWKDGPELSQTELAARLRLHKSTVYRILSVLEEHRFVEKASNGKYRLGTRLFEIGSRAGGHLNLREKARPYLERLVYETGETAHLCILDEGEVLYLEKVEAQRTVRVPSNVGRRYPAHCGAAGKSLLAFLGQDEVDEIIKRHGLKPFTHNTVTTPAQLHRELQVVNERGYAVDNEEFEEGLECVGAPIRDYSGKVIASISVAGPTSRITNGKLPGVAHSVVQAAKQLSVELGHHEEAAAEHLAVQRN
jgi:IclR family KDG regulon transcriptional repressor